MGERRPPFPPSFSQRLIAGGASGFTTDHVDRVRYEAWAKSIIFLPLAISMVAAGVIWKFMYDYKPPGEPQTGTVNAAIGAVGLGPVGWLQSPSLRLSTFAMIAVMVWMWTG